MRGFVLKIVVGSLLLAGSFVASARGGHPWSHGHTGSYSVFIPAVGTGCFGEHFPVLMAVPGMDAFGSTMGGTWTGGGDEKGEANAPPATMSPAEGPTLPEMKKEDDKSNDGSDNLLQLISRRSVRPVNVVRELETIARFRVAGKPLDLSKMTRDDAEPLFWKGYRCYFHRQYEEASAYFEAATKLNEQDARFWYFRSLSESALGQEGAAERSARRAADLHLQGLPSEAAIRQSLERVQGEPRMRLRQVLDARRAAR